MNRFLMGEIACSTHTIQQLLGEVSVLLLDKTLQPRTILCLNAHIYNRAAKNGELRGNLNAARIVAADGMAIVWAARLFGARIAERCNMTEAFRAFLTSPQMPPSSAVLIGCTSTEAKAAAVEIHRLSRHCRVIEAVSGYLSDPDYRRICDRERADLVLLGMGTPRTEQVSAVVAEVLPQALVWGIGGGTVRILAGQMREAPVFWRRLGLQWVHRLAGDPAALWKRYLVGNPVFMFRIIKAACRVRHGQTQDAHL